MSDKINDEFLRLNTVSGNIVSRSKCAAALTGAGQWNEAAGQYKILIEEIEKIRKDVLFIEKSIQIMGAPSKAYCASYNEYLTYIPAKSHGNARWAIVRAVRDMSYTASNSEILSKVRVVRAPKYDEWAKTAKVQIYGPDQMPEAK